MTTLFNRDWSKDELLRRVGQMDQLAGIHMLEELDGKSSRPVGYWTCGPEAVCVPGKCRAALDIASCEFKGMAIAWRSPAGNVHPSFYKSQGLGWLRLFPGGLLTTCGLNQFGSPSQEEGAEFGLHGRISNIPASQVNYRSYWEGNEYRLEIAGETHQAALFSENLVLRRRITTTMGSNSIHIDDVVTNEGFETTPHMLLYHFNAGFPLLSEDTRLTLHSEKTVPR